MQYDMPTAAALATPPLAVEDVFEGPEKKLEVFFSMPSTGTDGRVATAAAGFRSFDEPVWSELLTAARCTILHCQPSEHFDAYLLSESSLFVYPSRVILKTCGTTTLLLVLPKLLALAATLGASLEHVHYSRFRYKFPHMQLYPHTSFDVEERYLTQLLEGHVAGVHAKCLADDDSSDSCWFALCTEALPAKGAAAAAEEAKEEQEPPRKKLATTSSSPSTTPTAAGLASVEGAADVPMPPPPLPADVDDLFEVAMEGLAADVCAVFCEAHAAHGGASGRALARSMTARSGIGALLEGVVIDDWAFEPCGYSMNGSRGAYYYTIHITPELDFSYASFETNDPAFRAPERVAAIVDVFRPSSLTVTLTTRRSRCGLPAYELPAHERTAHEHHHLTAAVSVCCLSFAAVEQAAPVVTTAVVAAGSAKVVAAATAGKDATATAAADVFDATGSEASSDDTAELSTDLLVGIL